MLPFLVAALAAAPSADPAAKYARPDFLVEPADLAAVSANAAVIDLRPKSSYDAGHAPGAVHYRAGAWIKAVNDKSATADYWKRELSALGVVPSAPVVVYSDDAKDACRGWWLLKLAGVPDVRLVNGGWGAYAAAKLPVSKEAVAPKPGAPTDWKPEPRLALKADVVKLAEAKDGGMIDARAAAEYAGGRVPGAKPLEWSELLDPATEKFKPAAELKALFDARKIDLTKPCVTYCQGGGRASVLAFGLELMGAKEVRNYQKSWGEYGTDPATPKEK